MNNMKNLGKNKDLNFCAGLLKTFICLIAIFLLPTCGGNRVGNPDKFTDVDENKKVKSVNMEFIAINSSQATKAQFNVKSIKFLKEGNVLEEFKVEKTVATEGDDSKFEVQFKRSDFDVLRYNLNDSGNSIVVDGKSKEIDLLTEFDIDYTYDKTKERTSIVLFDLNSLYLDYLNTVEGLIALPLTMINVNQYGKIESSYKGYDRFCVFKSEATVIAGSECFAASRIVEKPDGAADYLEYEKYDVHKFDGETLVDVEKIEITENKSYSLSEVKTPSVDPEINQEPATTEEVITPAEAQSLNLEANLLINGDFENAEIAPWSVFTNNDASLPKITNEITTNPIDAALGKSVKLVVPAKTPETGQIYQKNIALEPKQNYLLSLTVCGLATSELSVSIINHRQYTMHYGLKEESIAVTNQCQEKNIRFTTIEGGSTLENGRLVFWLSRLTDAGTYYLDNIKLQKIIPE